MSKMFVVDSAQTMRLEKLIVTNFRALREVDVTFPDGLLGIMGPNGSGKTTLTASISWALFGMEGVRWKKDSLIGPLGDDTEVIFTFRLGQTIYTVKRSLIGKSMTIRAELFRDDELLASSNDGVTAELIRLIGSPAEWFVSRFVGQKQLNAFSVLEPAPRKRLILKLIGVQGIEEGIKALRDQVSDFDKNLKARKAILPNITDIDRQIEALRARHNDLVARLAEARLAAQAISAEEVEANSALARLEEAADTAASHVASLTIIASQLADLDAEEARLAEREETLKRAEVQLAEVENRLAAIVEHAAEYNELERISALRRRIPDLESQEHDLAVELDSLRRRVAELTDKADRLASLVEREAFLIRAIEDAGSRRAVAESERNELRAALSRNREELARIEAQMADLENVKSDQMVCPTCGQALRDVDGFRRHLAEKMTAMQAERADIIAAGKAAKAASEQAASERAALELELIELRQQLSDSRAAESEKRLVAARLADYQQQAADVAAQLAEARALAYDENRHAILAAEAESYPSLLALRAQLTTQLADRIRLNEDRARLAERRAAYTARHEAAEAAAKSAGYDPNAHEIARERARAATAAAREAAVAVAALDGECRLAASELARLEADKTTHRRLTAEIDRLLIDRGTLELTREVMERFKINLIGRIRPALERKASILLRQLSDGRYTDLILDDDYEISIGAGGQLRSIRDISGGEEDLANLCLRLAISELINESTGVGNSFLILDEVLGSQDLQRELNIMDVLSKLSGHFVQILMITHKPAAPDRFPSVLNAEWDPVTETSRFIYPTPNFEA